VEDSSEHSLTEPADATLVADRQWKIVEDSSEQLLQNRKTVFCEVLAGSRQTVENSIEQSIKVRKGSTL
jgi:hypothetical protein